MADVAQILFLPFLTCLLLVAIHAYLGVHVLMRKVIFVDLALAQMAALGSVCGVVLGADSNTWILKLFSFGMTILGALILSVTRSRAERIPHESVIGVVYAVALSFTILLSSQLPHGADELRELLSGNILWMDWDDFYYTAFSYAGLGFLFWNLHSRWIWVSNSRQIASDSLYKVRLWDFVFYLLFGFVVTSSVQIAGVLLVFAFLVIPAGIGMLLARDFKRQLCIAWGFGICASGVGMGISYTMDWSSGPTIVIVLGAFLAVVSLYVHVDMLRK